jgi:hypothetical protein
MRIGGLLSTLRFANKLACTRLIELPFSSPGLAPKQMPPIRDYTEFPRIDLPWHGVTNLVFRAGRLLSISLVVLGFLYDATLAQSSLEYRNRGNRYEGVRALPVSGYTIELLSFRALYEEPGGAGGLPPQYRVRFFLEKEAPAYLVVREIDDKESYWLDNVKPKTSWASGFNNLFEWPTADVLAHIPALKLYDLGVIVRVADPNPTSKDRVAPAILYHSQYPTSVSGYKFVFKTNATVGFEFMIEESDGRVPKSQPEPRVVRTWQYKAPLSVKWDASTARPGRYRLKVIARVLENNDKLTQEVEFVHQPNVR